jgi:hypothetical protein
MDGTRLLVDPMMAISNYLIFILVYPIMLTKAEEQQSQGLVKVSRKWLQIAMLLLRASTLAITL